MSKRRIVPAGLWPRNSRWFDGVDDHVDSVSPYLADSDVTFAAWLRPERLTGAWQTAMFAGGIGGNRALLLGVSNTNLWGCGVEAGSFAYSATPPRLGQWSRVVMTRPAGNSRTLLYVDGLLAGTAAATVTFAPAGFLLCTLGRYSTVLPFGGNIWDARMYSRVWSQTEVAADFRGEVVDVTNLVRSWALNDQTPATTLESVGGTNDMVTGAVISTLTPMVGHRIVENVDWAPGAQCDIPDHADLRPDAQSCGFMGWWFQPTGNATRYIYTKTVGGILILSVGNGIVKNLNLRLNDGALNLNVGGPALPDGWNHIAFSIDRTANTVSIYVNGKFYSVTNLGALAAISPTDPLRYAFSPAFPYNDYMWRKGSSFTLSEIENHYYNGVAPSNLTSHWLCREGAGTTIADIVGGHGGTLTAASWTTNTRSKRRQVS